MQVVGGDVGVLGGDLVEGVLPEVPGEDQHVVLVDQRELLARACLGAGEGVADDALHAVRGVDADLGGDLGGGAGAQRAAVARVRALGALADHHEVDLRTAGQRGGGVREELRGAEVDEVVEGEAELQQQAALQDAGGDRGVADGAEEDRVVLLERLQLRVGQGLARAVPAARAEVVLLGLQLHILGEDGVEDLQTLGHDLLADAVTGDHCEIDAARHGRTLLLVPRGDTDRPSCGRTRPPVAVGPGGRDGVAQ